jgi:hypothetical protein
VNDCLYVLVIGTDTAATLIDPCTATTRVITSTPQATARRALLISIIVMGNLLGIGYSLSRKGKSAISIKTTIASFKSEP